MRILLLAAGRGTRISRYLSGNPKCTVDIGQENLIQYTVRMFKKKNINNIAMVLGYRENIIKDALREYDIKYYYNPFFDVTNSIASAWFAKDFFKDDDVIIMNADVFLEESLINRIIQCKKSPVMFADSRRKEEADYKFMYRNGILMKYGKELKGREISGEYIGIGKFSRGFITKFLERMEKIISYQQHYLWWENVIYSMIGETDIYIEEINDMFWAEVDYIEDYERILNFRKYKFDFK